MQHSSENTDGTPSKKFGGELLLGTIIAAAFIAFWEGGKDSAGSVVYADKLASGLPTVCAGLTHHVTTTPIIVGQRWSAEKCLSEEKKALLSVQLPLEQCFKILPPQNVFDAATSHAWNFGVRSTCQSSAMTAWNAGNWDLGCKRLAFADDGRRIWSYVRSGDGYKFVKGLANRRDAEYAHCIARPKP